MRKKSTRLVSAALAACMMLSVLPVGAFAAEPGTEPENTVTAQKETKGYPLKGSEKINEGFVVAHGTVYTLSGNYTQGITIETEQDITINIDDEVTITGVAKFLDVTGTGKVTINGTKDGADQNIKMTTDHDHDVIDTGYTGVVFLEAAGADVTCNGGDYYSKETSHVGASYSVFCVKDGSLKLNEVTAEAGMSTHVINCEGNSSASVEIHEGNLKHLKAIVEGLTAEAREVCPSTMQRWRVEIMCFQSAVRVQS